MLENGCWARNWDCCQGCGTIERQHVAKGLCVRCYQRGNHCIDCGAEICSVSTYCRSCATQRCWKDESWCSNRFEAASDAMKLRWERGDFDDLCDQEWLQKISETQRKRWENGAYDNEESRQRHSDGLRAAWVRGAYDDRETEDYQRKRSDAMTAAWARGDFEGVFQSPTSIELQVAAALDIMGIEHTPQYRPDGYSRIYDEFVPPNTLIEINGDYFHSEEHFPGIERRDAEKAQWAEENGFGLVVLWEHEIKEQGAWALVMERVGGV